MEKTDVLLSESWNDFEISHIRRKGAFNMPADHYHDSYELYYLLAGERFYFIKDRTLHIKRGDLVIINRFELHKTLDASGTSTHERILVNFKPGYLSNMTDKEECSRLLSAFDSGVNLLSFEGRDRSLLESLFLKMLKEAREKLDSFETATRTGLIDILILIGRHLKRYSAGAFTHPTPMHGKISEIVRFINDNYMKELNLQMLSSRFFISQFYLSRVFKEVTGFTFIEYLNSVRIKEAQKLLAEGGESVTAVAERVGYDSITHFERVFKGMTGLPPSAFRKLSKPQAKGAGGSRGQSAGGRW